MANLIDLFADTGAALIGDDSTASLRVENSSTGDALDLRPAGVSASAINVSVSGATGAVLNVSNIGKGFVSSNSTASLAYALTVKIGGAPNLRYFIPVYTGA